MLPTFFHYINIQHYNTITMKEAVRWQKYLEIAKVFNNYPHDCSLVFDSHINIFFFKREFCDSQYAKIFY